MRGLIQDKTFLLTNFYQIKPANIQYGTINTMKNKIHNTVFIKCMTKKSFIDMIPYAKKYRKDRNSYGKITKSVD